MDKFEEIKKIVEQHPGKGSMTFPDNPFPIGRVEKLLTEAIEESGYSPYVPGGAKKLTKLIKATGLDILQICHESDEFGCGLKTTAHFVLWDPVEEDIENGFVKVYWG